MFGFGKRQAGPSGGGGLMDALGTIGATLVDIDNPGAGALRGLTATRAARQKQAQQQALLAELLPQITGPGGVSGASEDALVKASIIGLPGLDNIISLRAQNKPEYVRGMRVRPFDNSAPSFIPDTEKGQTLMGLPGGGLGIANAPGAVQSASEMEAAKAAAQEGVKAGLDVIEIPMADGSTVRLPRLTAVQALSGNVAGLPAGFGRTPSTLGKARDESLGKTAGSVIARPNGDGSTTPMLGADIFGLGASPGAGAGRAAIGPGRTPTTAESTFHQQAGKDAADRLKGLQAAVDGDKKLMPLVEQMEKILDGGQVVTGFGADARLDVERAMAALGDDKAKRRVSDTETYQNLTSRQVLPLVKQLGAGNGITDADRKFTQSIVVGDIELDEQTMRRVIGIARRQAEFNTKALGEFKPPGGQSARSGGGGASGAGYTVLGVRRGGQ